MYWFAARAVRISLMLMFFGTLVSSPFPASAVGLSPFVSVSASTIAIEHVRLIDGSGAPVQPDETVVFHAGTITAVGPAGHVSVPADATIISGSGKTLLPGYVGAHNHLFTGTGGREHHFWRSMPTSFPRLYLAAGTTTIRTTGSMDIFTDLAVKHAIDAGTAVGPAIDVTSPYLTGPANTDIQMYPLRDADDARATVDYWADRGVTSFKVYTDITRASLAAVIDEAHRRKLKVMGHLCSVGYSEAAALGIDELEHGPYFTDTDFVPGHEPDVCPVFGAQQSANADVAPGDPRVSALIADLVRRRVPISSTLPVYEAGYDVPSASEMEPALALMSAEQRADVEDTRAALLDPKTFAKPLAADPQFLVKWKRLFENEMKFEVRFLRAGGLLTCGPDPSGYGSVIAGLGDWRELELLVRAGLTPIEAIHVATQNGAIALGRETSVGTVAVGKQADLILIDGDPSTRIADIENVETVFKAGTGYDSKKLMESVKGLVGRL